MSIQVQGLTKIYDQQKAIDEISFTAERGQITGLLGPNGAGKTTTMKILSCYMPASYGSATICGLHAGKDDLEIKKRIGYLPEHNPLYGSMYVKEYLSFVASLHRIKNRSRRIGEVIELVGLDIEQGKPISALSKGYKQRVGLAQVLIHDPEVLILDEPISGLDPNQLVEIRNMISGLKKNKTIIFSSHILQEVESICDQIVILDRGKIVADDTLVSLSQTGAIQVAIRLELKEAMQTSLLQKLPGVKEIIELKPKVYKIIADDGSDIREQLFDYVVSTGNKILGLEMEKQSLESVFKDLTS